MFVCLIIISIIILLYKSNLTQPNNSLSSNANTQPNNSLSSNANTQSNNSLSSNANTQPNNLLSSNANTQNDPGFGYWMKMNN